MERGRWGWIRFDSVATRLGMDVGVYLTFPTVTVDDSLAAVNKVQSPLHYHYYSFFSCWSAVKQPLSTLSDPSYDTRRIILGIQNKQICMSTGQCPCLNSGIGSWQIFGHVYLNDTLPKIMFHETVKGSYCKGRPRKCHHCWALQTTEVDGQPSQHGRLSDYPTTPWASWVLWILKSSNWRLDTICGVVEPPDHRCCGDLNPSDGTGQNSHVWYLSSLFNLSTGCCWLLDSGQDTDMKTIGILLEFNYEDLEVPHGILILFQCIFCPIFIIYFHLVCFQWYISTLSHNNNKQEAPPLLCCSIWESLQCPRVCHSACDSLELKVAFHSAPTSFGGVGEWGGLK